MRRGYDLVLLGQVGPTKINVDELQRRLDRPDYSAVIASLRAVGFQSAVDILATYLGQASDLHPLLLGAQLNLDRNLRLQYLAGLEMNSRASEPIYHLLSSYRRFPETLFVGSENYIQLLRALLKPSNWPLPFHLPHLYLSRCHCEFKHWRILKTSI